MKDNVTRTTGLVRRVRSAAAPAAKGLLMRGGIYSALRRFRPSDGVAILRYHAICDPDAGYADRAICISPGAFEEHVRYLAARYAVLPLSSVVACLRAATPLPPNTVVITFDDGYADNLRAARVLHGYGCSATFYITSSCMAGGQPFWPAELRVLVAAITAPSVTVQAGPVATTISLDDDRARRAAVTQLTRLFKSHPIAVRERLREQLREAAGSPAVPSVMLTWDEIREMHRLGMSIGAHTMTHPNLPSAGLVDAEQEIRGVKARLEHEIGDRVDLFSYPNGGAERYFTADIQRLVREAGYSCAVTSRNAFAGIGSDLFAMERVQVAERLEDLVFALEVERFVMKPVTQDRRE